MRVGIEMITYNVIPFLVFKNLFLVMSPAHILKEFSKNDEENATTQWFPLAEGGTSCSCSEGTLWWLANNIQDDGLGQRRSRPLIQMAFNRSSNQPSWNRKSVYMGEQNGCP